MPLNEDSARAAGLRYVSDTMPGISRRRSGKGFVYYDSAGRRVTDRATLERIRRLALPPAYTDVWICPLANGHLQASGRDARGRKQYRYHERWREHRDQNKYSRLAAFGRALPAIRERVAADLKRPGLPRDKVLATVVDLLDKTQIRVGNRHYARSNKSFGLTTLRNRHIRVEGNRIEFEFRGKSGILHRIQLRDARLARIVRQCQDLPGYELFQYLDEQGQRHTVDSSDVNQYLREIGGNDFSAKDFRTWHGTLLAAAALMRCPPPSTATETRRHIVQAVDEVAAQLGNTRAICRKCYVHPDVIAAYEEGRLAEALGVSDRAAQLAPDEAALLHLLNQEDGPP